MSKRKPLDVRTLRSVGRELRDLGKSFLEAPPSANKWLDDAKGQLLRTWGSIYLMRAGAITRPKPKAKRKGSERK